MKIRNLFLGAGIALLALKTNAQTKPDVLINKNIVELYNAGLSDKLIISKIESSDAKFDVSTNGLIALKKANISEDVIEAMVNKSAPSVSKNSAINNKKTGVSDAPEIENINEVLLITQHALKPLEKSTATMHSRTKALGYGGAEVVFQVDGNKSPVRFAKDSTYSFIVNTGGGPGDAFVLYKVNVAKTRREAVSATFGTFSGMKGAKGIIPVDVKMVKGSVYKIVPSATLDKGEYFFAGKSAGSTLSSTTIDVYAFGID